MNTINITRAAGWLRRGEKALSNEPDCDRPMVRYCVAYARYELARAQESARQDGWGYVAIVWELIYLLGLPALIIFYTTYNNIAILDLMRQTVFQVPILVFVWGFLGGVAWCLYGAADWSNQRLFDAHYFPWYIAHPWISAVLGAASALLIIGGLSALGTFDPDGPVGAAILSLVGFVTGFSTHKFWKLLDRAVSRLLGDRPRESPALEETNKQPPQPEDQTTV